MCRLLGWAALAPASPAELLAPEELARLVALGRFHGDGWGMALAGGAAPGGAAPGGVATAGGVAAPGGMIAVHRSTEPAASDPELARRLATGAARAGIVHLRRATPGIAVTADNTHPFLAGGWAFAHNGSITPLSALDSLLSPAWAARRRGGTDSERYFLALLERLESAPGALAAARRTVADVRGACGWHGMNAVAISSDTLLVVHAAARAAPSRQTLLALLGEAADDPAAGIAPDHLRDYYGLRYRVGAGSLLVSSTGAPGPGWRRLPAESVLVCDLGTGRVEISSLGGGPPLRRHHLTAVGAPRGPVVR